MRPGIIIVLCVLLEHAARLSLTELLALDVTHNSGAAFGILRGTPELALWLSVMACVMILCVIFWVRVNGLARLGLAVMAGGALSNLLERIFLGYVIDWIPVPFVDLNYNLADVEISLGAFLTFIACL